MAEPNNQKRRRTKAEKAEHAIYAQRSSAKKRSAGLVRLSVWVPAGEKSAFKSAADFAMEQFLKKVTTAQTCDICEKSYKRRSKIVKCKKSGELPDLRQKPLNFG